jgi:hypothetical protein
MPIQSSYIAEQQAVLANGLCKGKYYQGICRHTSDLELVPRGSVIRVAAARFELLALRARQ